MGEVKRWTHHVTWDGDLNIQATMMALRSDGEYVLATDYATLEAENAKLRAELERRAVDGWKLVPEQATPEMVSASRRIWPDGEAFTRERWRAMLAAAPSAPKADDPVKVQSDDATRLDFMLIRNRKVVVERLPNDNFAVYVEEGFMGDKVYPSVSYSGEWASGSSEELELKRKAIDAAIAATRQEGGKV